VFGAYTAVPWSSPSDLNAYKYDSTAFIFSLTNPANNPLKLKVIKPESAVIHHSTYGIFFGGGYDLGFKGFDSSSNFLCFMTYESPNGLTANEGGKYVLGGSDITKLLK